jgi:hypothetical protein
MAGNVLRYNRITSERDNAARVEVRYSKMADSALLRSADRDLRRVEVLEMIKKIRSDPNYSGRSNAFLDEVERYLMADPRHCAGLNAVAALRRIVNALRMVGQGRTLQSGKGRKPNREWKPRRQDWMLDPRFLPKKPPSL